VTSRPPAGSRRRDIDPVWSPDGTRLVFTRIDSADGGLYVVDANGGGLRRLYATYGSQSLNPAWSPDGTSVAFSSSATAESCVKGRASSNWVLTVAVDGSSPPSLVARRDKTVVSGEAWSPSGGQLLYIEAGACAYYQRIDVLNADGTDRHVLATSGPDTPGLSRAAWSPDGTRISYTSDCSDYPGAVTGCNIVIMNTDGTKERAVAGFTTDNGWCGASDPTNAVAPVWTPNGHSILVAENGLGGSGGAGVYEKNIETNKARRVVATQYGPGWLTLSADGTELAFITGTCSLVRVVGLKNGTKRDARVPEAWNRRSAPAIWLR
jgi:TolB protein